MQNADLFNAALSLPYDVRLELANQLWDSLSPPAGVLREGDDTFVQDIQNRCETADAGEIADVTADEVIQRLRDRHAARK